MTKSESVYKMTINGELAGASRAFAVINPATREEIAVVPDASREQLDGAVNAAARAFKTWSQSSHETRKKALEDIAGVLEANAEEFMALLTAEQGKPRAGAEWEVMGAALWCREMAKHRLVNETLEDSAARKVYTRFTPLGVVGAITPWNFPLLLAVWKIAPALMSGNCIIVKPSPFTPLCTLKLGELCRRCLPPGVFSVVTGGDERGKWITSHPGIAKIAFTGSTGDRQACHALGAGNLKRLTLELGGNDPAIVLADVDPKQVAPKLFWALFRTMRSSATRPSGSTFTIGCMTKCWPRW